MDCVMLLVTTLETSSRPSRVLAPNRAKMINKRDMQIRVRKALPWQEDANTNCKSFNPGTDKEFILMIPKLKWYVHNYLVVELKYYECNLVKRVSCTMY